MTRIGPAGRPAEAQADPFPIYTYLMNAGLSPADVRRVGDEILRLMRERLKKKALSDDADERRRYMTDRAYREGFNKQVVADVIAELRFVEPELMRLDQGLRLGLIPKRVRTGPLVAHTIRPNGEPEDFEVLDRGARPVVRSRKDGRVYQF